MMGCCRRTLALLAPLCHAAASDPPSASVGQLFAARSPGLSIEFNASAVPVSLKNAQGDELLAAAGSLGFSLRTSTGTGAKQHHGTGGQTVAEVQFDTIAPGPGGPNTFTFGVSSSAEKLDVAIDGANHYLTVNITATRGFVWGDGAIRLFSTVFGCHSTDFW